MGPNQMRAAEGLAACRYTFACDLLEDGVWWHWATVEMVAKVKRMPRRDVAYLLARLAEDDLIDASTPRGLHDDLGLQRVPCFYGDQDQPIYRMRTETAAAWYDAPRTHVNGQPSNSEPRPTLSTPRR